MTRDQITASLARLAGRPVTTEIRLREITYTGTIDRVERDMVTITVPDGWRPTPYTVFVKDIESIAVVPLHKDGTPIELVFNSADSFAALFDRQVA